LHHSPHQLTYVTIRLVLARIASLVWRRFRCNRCIYLEAVVQIHVLALSAMMMMPFICSFMAETKPNNSARTPGASVSEGPSPDAISTF
jgi:hypothetical protein